MCAREKNYCKTAKPRSWCPYPCDRDLLPMPGTPIELASTTRRPGCRSIPVKIRWFVDFTRMVISGRLFCSLSMTSYRRSCCWRFRLRDARPYHRPVLPVRGRYRSRWHPRSWTTNDAGIGQAHDGDLILQIHLTSQTVSFS